MNWVKTQVTASGRPSLVSNSTGGAFSQAQNDAVDSVYIDLRTLDAIADNYTSSLLLEFSLL